MDSGSVNSPGAITIALKPGITVQSRYCDKEKVVRWLLSLDPPYPLVFTNDPHLNERLPVAAAGLRDLPLEANKEGPGSGIAEYLIRYEMTFQLGIQNRPIPSWLAVRHNGTVHLSYRTYIDFHKAVTRVAAYFGITVEIPDVEELVTVTQQVPIEVEPSENVPWWQRLFPFLRARPKAITFNTRAALVERLLSDINAEVAAGLPTTNTSQQAAIEGQETSGSSAVGPALTSAGVVTSDQLSAGESASLSPAVSSALCQCEAR